MSKIQIIDLNVNSEELRDLSDAELNVQGGGWFCDFLSWLFS
jgi:hypothetical protein